MDGVEPPFHNGRLVNMSNNLFYDYKLSKEDLNSFLDSLINKIFAILAIYEDCEKLNEYSTLSFYMLRVSSEIKGFSKIMKINSFISLCSILEDIREKISLKELGDLKCINHDEVKSLIFHCISIVKKEKVL